MLVERRVIVAVAWLWLCMKIGIWFFVGLRFFGTFRFCCDLSSAEAIVANVPGSMMAH